MIRELDWGICDFLCACSVMFDSLQPHGLTHQVPLSMEFFRQEYRNGLPFPIPWDLPDPGIEHMSSGVSYISCIGRQILYH